MDSYARQGRGGGQGYGGGRGGGQGYSGGRGDRGGRGGRGGGQSRGGRGGGFASKPTARAGGKVSLVTNQFVLKLGKDASIYQYPIEIVPMAIQDSDLATRIVRTKRKAITTALGPFVHSGNSIYVLSAIEDDEENSRTVFDTKFKNEKYNIIINTDTVRINPSLDTQTINIIVKEAFRGCENLRQIGNRPNFFDTEQPIELKKQRLQAWPGFKGSCAQSELGFTLAIDNIFKFMTTTNCMVMIDELSQKANGNYKRLALLAEEKFMRKSIIADWGAKRTYIVDAVVFDKNPATHKFEHKGKMMTVAEYFKQVYKKVIQNTKQPMFLCKVAGNECYLPTQFCLVDGVPAEVRANGGMRDVLASIQITPKEKLEKVERMCQNLVKQEQLAQWDVILKPEPVILESRMLNAPLIKQGKDSITCDQRTLQNLAIQNAVPLEFEEWLFVYEKRNFDHANTVFGDLKKACGRLKMTVEEPYWIELARENNKNELEEELLHYMNQGKGKGFRHPTMCLVILGYENNYHMYKKVLQHLQIPSQVVTAQNARRFNLSKAGNILRQINSKMGGDLFNLRFPKALDKKRTMLIGIDVCHEGQHSTVGFAASTNKEMSQYFSDYLIQNKNQELVSTPELRELIRSAIEVFAENHNDKYPTNFIIYRDGVGDEQREQVLGNEIPKFDEVIGELYHESSFTPEITVIVVNKRVIQRFFEVSQGQVRNPGSGCIVDKTLVKQQQKEDGQYDFFLLPVDQNQGCARPTHFYVSRDDSDLTQKEIQELTFALCHFYFNWAGPVKVPAPCQYAHKIADLFYRIRTCKEKINLPAATELELKKVMPLNEKLHFL